MQRIRKLSNDLKEALIPKSDQSDPRRRPSYRGGQSVQTGNIRKTTNSSVGYHASSAVTSRSREARTEQEQREREGRNQVMKPGREQGIGGNSVAFPPSSSRPKTRTKAQEKPVPVPSVNHTQTASDGTYWDRDVGGTSPATSPHRYVLDSQTKPLPLPPGTDIARKPHRRCPYSPSRYFVVSQSTPDVSFPARMGTPATNGRTPASLADVDMESTTHSTQSQPGTPAWPPEGPATVKRQQRTPKSSIESLYCSPTDMKEFRAPATAASPKDAGHGHSRTASAPVTTDTHIPLHRREQRANRNPEPKPLFGDTDSLISSKASYHTALTTIDTKPSLAVQVRELSTSRAVHVQSHGVRRAASCKAQIVYPSYVTGPLPPLPGQAPVPAPVPAPIPQRQVQAHTPTRRRDEAAPQMMKPPKGHDEVYYTIPRSRASQEQRIEVSYITLREFAQMEGKKRHEDLNRELANWGGVDAAANAVPTSSHSYGGTTRPLVVRKRSEMFGVRGVRPARQ